MSATKMSPAAPGTRPLSAGMRWSTERDTLRAEWHTVFHSEDDASASSLRLKSPLRKPVSTHARAADGASTKSYHRPHVVTTESVVVDTLALKQDWLKSAIFNPRAEPLAWCGRYPSPSPTNCVAARSWSLVRRFSSSLEEIHKKRPLSARRVRLEAPLAARPSSACFSDRKHLRSTSHSHVIVTQAPNDVSSDLSPLRTLAWHSGHSPSRRLRHHNRHQDTLLRDLQEIKERVCEQLQELGQKQSEIEALKREVASAKALASRAAAGGQDPGSEEGRGESAAGATRPEAMGPFKPDVTGPFTPRAPSRKSLTLTRSASLKSVLHAPPTPSTRRRKVALYKANKPCGSIIFDSCGSDLQEVKEAFPVLFPLLDEGDKCLLVHALWKAAGEPRDGAREWGAAAEEGPGEAWSVENLERLEFQTLVDLQAVAGPGYRRSAPMALQLISLEQGNTFGDDLKFRPNKHLQPLEEYIKCEDWNELASSGGNLRLYLDDMAFATPSDYNSATQYENLKRHLFDQAECSNGWLTLWSSPLSTVNLDDTARRMAGVVKKFIV